MEEYVLNFLLWSAAKAQKDALTAAQQSGKAPYMVRTESSDACKWCRSKAGRHENPSSDMFHRHGGCKAKIETFGYKSRNGLLNNYKKTNGGAGAAAPIAPDGGQVVFRGTGDNLRAAGLELGKGFYVARDNSTAANFGNVAQLSLPLKSKDILFIASDTQYDKLVLDAQKWAVRTGNSLDANDFIPAYVRNLGYKAAEVAAAVDPLGGIAVYDPKIVARLQAQMQ